MVSRTCPQGAAAFRATVRKTGAWRTVPSTHSRISAAWATTGGARPEALAGNAAASARQTPTTIARYRLACAAGLLSFVMVSLPVSVVPVGLARLSRLAHVAGVEENTSGLPRDNHARGAP